MPLLPFGFACSHAHRRSGDDRYGTDTARPRWARRGRSEARAAAGQGERVEPSRSFGRRSVRVPLACIESGTSETGLAGPVAAERNGRPKWVQQRKKKKCRRACVGRANVRERNRFPTQNVYRDPLFAAVASFHFKALATVNQPFQSHPRGSGSGRNKFIISSPCTAAAAMATREMTHLCERARRPTHHSESSSHHHRRAEFFGTMI